MTIVLRQRSGPIITVIVWGLLALLLLDAAWRGAWSAVVGFAPGLILLGWLVFAVLWLPALIVTPDRLVVRDVLRTTTLPFAAISDIRLGRTVSITAEVEGRERVLRPWNAPGTPRRHADSGLSDGGRPAGVASHPSRVALDRWEQAADRGSDADRAGAETSWNLGVIALTVGLIAVICLIRLL